MLHAGQSALLGCCSSCLTCIAGGCCMSPPALAAGHGDTFPLLILLYYPMVGEVQAGMRTYIRPVQLPRLQISSAELNDMHS